MGDRDEQPDVAEASVAAEDVSGEAGGQQQRCLPEQALEDDGHGEGLDREPLEQHQDEDRAPSRGDGGQRAQGALGKKMIYTLLVGCRAINAAALAPIDDVAAVWGMGSTETSLIEVCCSKTSTLTECARNAGLTAERWGLFNDWDFDKDATVIRAKRHTESIGARRAWAATPCTQFAGPQG